MDYSDFLALQNAPHMALDTLSEMRFEAIESTASEEYLGNGVSICIYADNGLLTSCESEITYTIVDNGQVTQYHDIESLAFDVAWYLESASHEENETRSFVSRLIAPLLGAIVSLF